MEQWLSKETLLWLSVGSGIGLLIGAVAVPWILIRTPADIFLRRNHKSWLQRQPAFMRVPLFVLKNLIAIVLIILGIAMLVLPGQGILSILLGVMLADFPGKESLQQRIIAIPKVMHSINWLRRKFQRPPIEIRATKMAA